MPWIQTIAPEDADGRLAEAYQWQSRKLGRPTELPSSAVSTPKSCTRGWSCIGPVKTFPHG